ncbi:MAG TPA: ATP-binding protein [Terriglobales bacterium]|nr:ATP-binding protein [Terriglobales bacterium]
MPRLWHSSIAGKLVRLNALASGTALLLACAGFFIYDFYSFRADLIRNLGMQAQIIGSNSISALVFDDSSAAEKTLSALKAVPHIVLAEIHTPDGRTFASYNRARSNFWRGPSLVPSGQTEIHGFRNQHVFLTRSLTFEGKNIGTVCIVSDMSALRHRERNFVILIGTVLLVSLGTAMAVSSIARRSITDPIVQLSNVAAIVSRERNYSVRAMGAEGEDEVSGLVAAFNQMLEQIQLRDAALRDAQTDLERRVEERTAQLNAVNAELEAFSYSVSHDLRAPLRHISAFAKMMDEEYASTMDAGARKYLDRIQDRAKAMAELIEGLLNMAQLGRKKLVMKRTELKYLVKRVLGEIQPECEGRKIEWQIGELPTIDCEPELMKRVFTNLLTNAAKYSRQREVAVIEVGQFEQDGATVLFVRDNGAGFDPRYADKLFGVFQRLHRAEEFEGTGIGLATVKRIIQKHGGRIWATSEVNKGATFFFSLSSTALTPTIAMEAAAV